MINFLKFAGVIIVIAFAASQNLLHAQGFLPIKGTKQVNLGLNVVDVPHFYVGLDYALNDFLTVGPRISYGSETWSVAGGKWRSSDLIFSVRGDYHFSGHFKSFPSKLDLYIGPSIGYSIWNINDIDADFQVSSDKTIEYWAQIGARWFFTEKFAVNAEFNPGTLNPNGMMGGYINIGSTIKL